MKNILIFLFVFITTMLSAQQKIVQVQYCMQGGDTLYIAFFNKDGNHTLKTNYNPHISVYSIYRTDGKFKGSLHVYNNDTTFYTHRFFQHDKMEEVWYKHKNEEYLLDQYLYTTDSTSHYHFKDGKREYIEITKYNANKDVVFVQKRYFSETLVRRSYYNYNDEGKIQAEYFMLNADTIIKTTYSYSDNEVIIKKYGEGVLFYSEKKQYKNGKLKKKFTYDKQGLITRIQKYKYNKHGFLCKEIDLNLICNKDVGEEKKHIKTYTYHYTDRK
jgi:hypothetical protein